MQKVSKEQFLEMLASSTPVNNALIEEDITITTPINLFTLKDCRFNGNLIISSPATVCLDLCDVEILGNLELHAEIQLDQTKPYKNSINFSKVKIHKNFLIPDAGGNLKNGEIALDQISICDTMNICGLSTNSFRIGDSEIKNCKIDYGGIREMSLSSNKISRLEVNSALVGPLMLADNAIDEFRIDLTSKSASVRSERNSFTKMFNVLINGSDEIFTSKNDKFGGDAMFDFPGQQAKDFELELIDFEFEKGLSIFPSVYRNDEIISLGKLTIQFSAKTGPYLVLSDLEVKELILKGINIDSVIALNNIVATNITFQDFHNNKELSLIKVKSAKTGAGNLSITNTHLGKTRLIDCDFDTFDSLTLYDCQLLDVVPVSVNWPSDMKLNKLIQSNIILKKSSSNVFRQLKVIIDKMSDVSNKLRFKRFEYDALRLELKSNKGNCFDRFVLCASATNDYGQNWVKPIIIIIIITIIFFLLMVIALSDELTLWPAGGFAGPLLISEIRNYFYLFPQMFDPVRRLSAVLSAEQSKILMVQLVDISHRLIYGFFIFQIIKAFRKYSD